MEDGELSLLREALLGLRDELGDLLQSTGQSARPVDLDEPIGRLSRMDALQQQSMAVANRQGAQLRLNQVEAALLRLERDEYGDCLGCGEEMSLARLQIRPEAPFCVDCQGRREER